MENFIGTVVFLLPGFLMYFWLQAFGVNPVVRHTVAEFTTIAALLWIPVSVSTIFLHNLLYDISYFNNKFIEVSTIEELTKASQDPMFLLWFLLLSTVVSFVYSAIWSVIIIRLFRLLINLVRKLRGLAGFSHNASVWDEMFLKKGGQIVEVGKIDKEDIAVIGEIENVSRTFEPERINLRHIDICTRIVKKHKVPVVNMFIDIKSGTYVKVFDSKKFVEAQENDEKPKSIFLEEDS